MLLAAALIGPSRSWAQAAAEAPAPRPAAAAPADTAVRVPARPADSLAIVPTPRDTVSGRVLRGPARATSAAPDTSRRRRRFDAPRWVMMRSLVVPGWGQLVNGSWLKAVAVAGGEVGLGVAIADDLHALDGLLAQVNAARDAHDAVAEVAAVDAYNARQTTLVAREWLLGGVVVYALMDAYVDAHFRHFKAEFSRPAPATGGGGARPAQARASLRWTF